MKEKLEQIRNYAKEKIEDLKDLQTLNDLKVKILGKKGELTEILRGMKDLTPEERPIIGALVNTVKDEIDNAISSAEEVLKQKDNELSIKDKARKEKQKQRDPSDCRSPVSRGGIRKCRGVRDSER